MALKSIYNFFSRIFEEIEELRSYDGNLVDVLVGKMKPEDVLEIALPVAREKEWIGKSGQPDLTADEPTLFHYTRRKQLVWSVYFKHHFTEEERNAHFEGFNIKSTTSAVVKADDATSEVIFADFVRTCFYEHYEPPDPEEKAADEKRQRQTVGWIMTVLGLGGNMWVWFTAFFYDHIYKAASVMLPAILIVGLAFILFDLRETERNKYGGDVSGSDNSQMMTSRFWAITIIGILAGYANYALLYFLT